MTAWLKTFRRGHELSPHQSPGNVGPIGEQRVFYEPLSTHSDGSPKLTKHGDPMGKPNYEIGDVIAEYWSGSYEIGPSIWEVIGEPEISDRIGWGWQTPVELVATDDSVPLDAVGVKTES